MAGRVALLLAGDDVYVFDEGDERIAMQYTVLVGANLDVEGPIRMTVEAWDRRFSALAVAAEATIVDCRREAPTVAGEAGPRTFVVSSGDIDRCPRRSMLPQHYRDDGTCRCDEEVASGRQ